MIRIEPLGDRGFLASFADEETAAAWARSLRASTLGGTAEVVAAYRTVGILADPDRDDLDRLFDDLARFNAVPDEAEPGRRLTVPVFYEGDDLTEVAHQLGMSPLDVVKTHASIDYRVFAIGFQPGFPYAGYLPDSMAGLPRRRSPRRRVPAGSVAIVGRQTAIYPEVSPGGWHLLGRTPLRIVDLETAFFPIRAGDFLRFVPIDRDECQARLGERLS